MKLKSIRLQNFLSFGENAQVLIFSKHNVIVGPNDSGKTNVFRAIELVGELLRTQMVAPNQYYHNRDYEHPFEIEIEVSFDKEELDALTNFLVCSCMIDTISPKQDENQEAAHNLIKNVISEHGNLYFSEFLTNISIIVRSESRTIYPPEIMFRFSKNNKELIYFSYRLGKKVVRTGSYTSHNVPRLILNEMKKKYPELLQDYLQKKTTQLPDLDKLRTVPVSLYDLIYEIIPEDGSASIDFRSFRLDEFESRQQQTVPDLIQLRKFVSKIGHDGRAGMGLVDMISLIYNSSIVKTSDIRSRPSTSLNLVGEKKNDGKLVNLTGEDLPTILFSLRNSEEPSDKKRYSEILSEFKEISNGIEFDIGIREKSTTVKKDEVVILSQQERVLDESKILGIRPRSEQIVEQELVIQILKDGVPIPIEFTAAGRFETLVLLTALIGHKNKIILLDEPALNLHPILQKRILRIINAVISENSNQIITITHSPYLVDADDLRNIWKLTYGHEGTKVINLAKAIERTPENEQKKVIKELRKSDIRAILFQHGVILVEGPSDKVVIEKIDSYLSVKNSGAHIEDNEWSVLDVGGKDSAPLIVNLLKNLEIPYVVVLDYDALMRCQKKIKTSDGEILTSSVPYYISLTNRLTNDELSLLKNLQGKTQHIANNNELEKYLWYQQSELSNLIKLANSRNIFVFTSDLEGVLQSPTTKKESKPLKAWERINELIETDKIPTEFISLMKFIGEIITPTRK